MRNNVCRLFVKIKLPALQRNQIDMIEALEYRLSIVPLVAI
jgi:hypothetical protein